MLQFITHGLVLREVKTGEADKILTILTQQHGIISVAAKNSMRPKNKLFGASGLFCYSEWVLFEGKNIQKADSAAPIEVFFGLRNDIEIVSLAAYIAELIMILSPEGEEAARLLRLVLNSFYVIANKLKSPQFAKAVFEFRVLAETGFMPEVLSCYMCGKEGAPPYSFRAHVGMFLCVACAAKRGLSTNLDSAAATAMQHILTVDLEHVFNFDLKDESMLLLSATAEEFMLHNLDYMPKTLNFLKSMFM